MGHYPVGCFFLTWSEERQVDRVLRVLFLEARGLAHIHQDGLVPLHQGEGLLARDGLELLLRQGHPDRRPDHIRLLAIDCTEWEAGKMERWKQET